jgi:hypothetical protein
MDLHTYQTGLLKNQQKGTGCEPWLATEHTTMNPAMGGQWITPGIFKHRQPNYPKKSTCQYH